MKAAKTILTMALVVVGVGVDGCSQDPNTGYTMADQYRPEVRTVAVPMWTRGKAVYRRELEMRLTEALVKRIEMDTHYKVTSKAHADTVLTGTIDSVDQMVLSSDPDNGLPREIEATIVVSFTWTDLRSGKVLAQQDGFRMARTYIPLSPFNEDFYLGSQDAIDELAQRIVEQMEKYW
jgi:hypothetical protein